LQADQRCKNIKQKLYENNQILNNMMEDVDINNFVELLVTVNTTLECYLRFVETHNLEYFIMT